MYEFEGLLTASAAAMARAAAREAEMMVGASEVVAMVGAAGH